MPARELQTAAVVLAAAPSGENHLRLHLLSADAGRVVALWRRSSKTSGSGPDLFDHAAYSLESSASGTTWFIREYRLERRRLGIAKRYRALVLATRLGDLLWRNLQHAEFFEPLAQLAADALNAFEDSPLPRCIYLKAVYRLAAEEGYAVRQQWLASLPRREQELARGILHQPLEVLEAEAENAAEPLIEKLERWLRADTDIIVP